MNIAKSRAKRILAHLSQYEDLTTSAAPPAWLDDLAPGEKETLLGVYHNAPGAPDDSIVVSDAGLCVWRNGSWDSLRYADIAAIESPVAAEKHRVDQLTVHMVDGRSMTLPVRGGDAKLRDAWAFVRFLNRVVADLQRSRGGAAP
jgi:hypothetical protein